MSTLVYDLEQAEKSHQELMRGCDDVIFKYCEYLVANEDDKYFRRSRR